MSTSASACWPSRSGWKRPANGCAPPAWLRTRADALRLAALYVTSHQIEKDARRRARLRRPDRNRTRVLLTQKVDAAWVLYKLDGGIDHILLDEAQDTAPEQWAILRALTSDFFSGAGAVRWRAQHQGRTPAPCSSWATRSSRSIRSRAPIPSACWRETQGYIAPDHGRRARGQGRALLTMSYRSTVEVLSFVDALFSAPETRSGVPAPAGEDVVRHQPFRVDHKGCVDLLAARAGIAGRGARGLGRAAGRRERGRRQPPPGREDRRRDPGPDRAGRRGVRQGDPSSGGRPIRATSWCWCGGARRYSRRCCGP